jgi:hypothetical protein
LAERRKPNEKPDLTPDALAPAAGDQPPDAVPIYGILGESPVASNVRLFLDVGLTTYYDIPIEGIVKREKVAPEQSPLGVESSLLFVLRGIKLTVHHTQTRTVEEEFLSGDFTAPGSFTPDPGGGPQAPGIPQPRTQFCGVDSQVLCPTRIETVCRPSLGITCTAMPICRLSHFPCPTVQPCVTKRPGLCPPLSHFPCPTVELWPQTQVPICPVHSTTGCGTLDCPTVVVCPTNMCGAGEGGDPFG